MFNFRRRPSDPDASDLPESPPEPQRSAPPPSISPLVAETTSPPAAPGAASGQGTGAPAPPAYGEAPQAPSPQAPPAAPAFVVRAAPRPAAPGATAPLASRPMSRHAEDATVVTDDGGSGPAILVVEDNNDTRMLLQRILRSTYDVTAVGDARSALMAMNERPFAGLVLDINLGGRETGADVLRIARSLPNHDGVFAVALTAYALPGDRERLLEAGFNEYISKPFTRQALMEALKAGVAA